MYFSALNIHFSLSKGTSFIYYCISFQISVKYFFIDKNNWFTFVKLNSSAKDSAVWVVFCQLYRPLSSITSCKNANEFFPAVGVCEAALTTYTFLAWEQDFLTCTAEIFCSILLLLLVLLLSSRWLCMWKKWKCWGKCQDRTLMMPQDWSQESCTWYPINPLRIDFFTSSINFFLLIWQTSVTLVLLCLPF